MLNYDEHVEHEKSFITSEPGFGKKGKSKKENSKELTQLKPRSHQDTMWQKQYKLAITKDIISGSHVNSHFLCRWLPG